MDIPQLIRQKRMSQCYRCSRLILAIIIAGGALCECRSEQNLRGHSKGSWLYPQNLPAQFIKRIEMEVNDRAFLRNALHGSAITDIDSTIKVRVNFSTSIGDEGGSLSVTTEASELSKNVFAKVADTIEKYADLRVKGHTQNYAKMLLFSENVAKSKQKLGRIGIEVANNCPDVLPSKLKLVTISDHKTWRKVVFEIRDGAYMWRYNVEVGMKGDINDIFETRPRRINGSKGQSDYRGLPHRY